MSTSLHLTPERPILLDPSKAALLQYITDRKEPLHNYQQRSIFWDREHLYNQNLTLRNKVKQLSESNTKTKTQLLKSQKQIIGLTNSRIPSTNIYRSTSTHQLKQDRELATLRWRVDALKDEERSKKMLLMKQQIRTLKEEVQKLQGQNSELKQSIKYTRMSQLQAETRELQEQLLRLRKIVSDTNRMHEELYRTYLRQKQQISLKVRKEVQNRGQLVRELKRAKAELEEERSKGKDSKTDRKLVMQIRTLQKENSNLKETIEAGIMRTNGFKVAQSRNDFTKLQYSASVFGDNFSSDRRLPVHSTPLPQTKEANFSIPSDLTSLQLLTPKVTLQEIKSPQKPTSAFIPSNLISEQGPNEENEESHDGFSKKQQYQLAEVEIEQQLQKRQVEQAVSKQHKQSYQSSQYEYIMEQL